MAVFLGGGIGVALRLALDAVIPTAAGDFPLATIIANVIGSFALGILVARVWPTASSTVKAAIGPGLLGGFTTFSAVVVAVVDEASRGAWMLAVGYLAATLVLGLSAAAAGLRVGQRGERVRRPLDIEVDE